MRAREEERSVVVDAAQLSGYLLEEVVTHLLQRSGYRLLGREDDVEALVIGGNGLRVRGRGAEHQADALGSLDVPVPFSFPIRLFVEAKNTSAKVGLGVVCNAHGVVDDVNEFVPVQLSSATKARHLRRVQYRYAVFSTSGFTKDAQDYAFTHQISLVDLSGPAWTNLATTLRTAAQDFLEQLAVPAERSGSSATSMARSALRAALLTAEPAGRDAPPPAPIADVMLAAWAKTLARSVVNTRSGERDILLGFVDAPFVLALQPDDTEAFTQYARGRGSIDVHIVYDRGRDGGGGEWIVYDPDDPERSRMTFPLPGVLEPIVLADVERNAAAVARDLLSAITVYVERVPVRLRYARSVLPEMHDAVAEDASAVTELRERRAGRARSDDLVEKPAEGDLGDGTARWSAEAIHELLDRLRRGGYVQEAMIRYAARHQGMILRDQIYEIGEFPPERMLRGLATPTNRIRRELIAEGLLDPEADFAFAAAYPHAVTASYYEVPDEFVDVLGQDPTESVG